MHPSQLASHPPWLLRHSGQTLRVDYSQSPRHLAYHQPAHWLAGRRPAAFLVEQRCLRHRWVMPRHQARRFPQQDSHRHSRRSLTKNQMNQNRRRIQTQKMKIRRTRKIHRVVRHCYRPWSMQQCPTRGQHPAIAKFAAASNFQSAVRRDRHKSSASCRPRRSLDLCRLGA